MNNCIIINNEVIHLNQKPLTCYICGPTVYNDSHLGHARTYLMFDIIRKILKNYFKQDMFVVMNITDIDDKIINRSRDEKVNFMEITKKYEKSFLEDMDTLEIDRVNIITRVSNYIEEIIKFIQIILNNGYAYISNNSVYFDTQAFIKKYPDQYNPFNLTLNNNEYDNEEYDQNGYDNEKKDKRDFSLWKAQKYDYEPSWENPFSEIKGRPAWSIECSVMASTIFGDHLDIHSGGIDLKFPHHNNEILQCAAYYDRDNYRWCNMFLHFGHLNISGLKMSKSLKNFITIRDILKLYSPRQVRLLFLQHNWDQTLDYSDNNIKNSVILEKTLCEFVAYLEYHLRKEQNIKQDKKFDHDDQIFNNLIDEHIKNIDSFLRNNLNTKDSILELCSLITDTYNYMKNNKIQYGLIKKVYDYILFLFKSFGLKFDKTDKLSDKTDKLSDILVNYRDKVRLNCFKIPNKKDLLNKSVDDLSNMILEIKNELLMLSDDLRDNKIKEVDIKIEDGNKDRPSLWKRIV